MPTIPRAGATAELPTGVRFTVTADALEMIGAFGGTLHCHEGPGGCRATGLYFSRTLPRKPVHAVLHPADSLGPTAGPNAARAPGNGLEDIRLSVSRNLAAQLQDAVLDFGDYNRMQRFIWRELPAAQGARCGCRRSFGTRAGKRSPCLDKQRVGLTDIPPGRPAST